MATLTLDRISTFRLVAIYNEWAAKPVAKFASKAAAVERVGRLCEERGLRLVQQEDGDVRLAPTDEGEAEEPAPTAGDSPPQAPQAAAGDDTEAPDTTPRAARRRGAGRAAAAASTDSADAPETAVIRVVQLPPAREGTNREARMAALRDGMTVGEYLDAAHEANSGRRARGRYRSDVRRLVAKGAIRLEM